MLSFNQTGLATCFTVDIQPKRRAWEMSWTLGTCKNSRKYFSSQVAYTESCCLVAGIHQLTCDASRGGGWPDGFIKIGKTHYCDNFYIGHQQTVDIEISGICTISNERTALVLYITLFVRLDIYIKILNCGRTLLL